jgi:hypothetical protein
MFTWNGGSSSNVQLWNLSDGYCYMNQINLGANAVGSVTVKEASGVWTLSGTSTASSASGVATCVSFPGMMTPVQQSQDASNNALTTISTNANFYNIAGIQYNQPQQTNANFQVSAHQYPATSTTVNLGEVVQNSFQGNVIFSECLAAPNQLWWGNTTLANAAAGQNVFVTDVNSSGHTVLDAPAASGGRCTSSTSTTDDGGSVRDARGCHPARLKRIVRAAITGINISRSGRDARGPEDARLP